MNGLVLDAFRQPIEGATVLIGTQAGLQTDAQGRFQIASATPPYDVILVVQDDVATSVWEFDGMSSPTPTFFLPSVHRWDQAHAASLIVQTDSSKHAAWAADVVGNGVSDVAEGSGTSAGLVLKWNGPVSAQVHLLAVEFDADASGAPTRYTGFAEETVPLADGQTLTATPAFGGFPWQTDSVSLTVTPPSGSQVQFLGVVWSFADGAAQIVLGPSSSATTASVPVPDIPGGYYFALAEAVPMGTGTGAWAASSAVSLPQLAAGHLVLSASPAILSPTDGAQGVTNSTDFAIERVPSGVHYVQMISSSSPRVDYFIASSFEHVHIPDVTRAGVALPQSAGYTWDAYVSAQVPSVDALAAAGVGEWTAGALSYDAPRTFTTAP